MFSFVSVLFSELGFLFTATRFDLLFLFKELLVLFLFRFENVVSFLSSSSDDEVDVEVELDSLFSSSSEIVTFY